LEEFSASVNVNLAANVISSSIYAAAKSSDELLSVFE
jgi:hypothetical protein